MNAQGNDSRIILPGKQFLRSCRILFGPEVQITPQFLGYLQPAGVKTAYRKLAMETHPDRSCHTGVNQAILEGAGGCVTLLDGTPLSYGKAAQGYLNPGFVAWGARRC